MKKIYFVLVSVMLFLSGATANAQFGQGDKFINTAEVIYSPVTFSVNMMGVDLSVNMNAVAIDWTQSYALMQDNPLYLLYGGVLQYTWGGKDFNDKGMQYFTATIPLSLGYDFVIPKTKFSVLPYAGINVYDHIIGKAGDIDLFDSYDMEGEEFEDFGFGWQVGAKFVYDRYILGVGYQGPISNLYSADEVKVNLSQVNISLGIRF